jgi:hypothetical protein
MLATSPLIEVREATAPVGDTNRGSQLLLSIMLKYSDLVIVYCAQKSGHKIAGF